MKLKSKKKIAILYSGGRHFGGIEQYLVNLFNQVDEDAIELELLSLGEWPLTERLKSDNRRVVMYSSKRVNLAAITAIGKYLKGHQFDLLVSQGTVANAYARAVSLMYKIPNLVTIHSNQAGDYSNPLIRTTYGLIEKLTRFPTTKYIVVSKYLKDRMVKSGLPASKIDVIYNGFDFPEPKAKPHKRLVIGSAGRLHPVKGYDLLINAFALLNNKRLRLKIAGSGDELDNLKKLAQDLCVADRVEFVGFKKDIFQFLSTLDIYVQSSRSEGFGLATAEAMSQSLPVVVTPAGSLSEIVEDGKTGLVTADFQPESIAGAIAQLAENYELSKKMGENAGRFAAKNFEIKDWADKTIKTYEEASR
jgi:glycosyltransferase involved in cell wall biosynthesis